MSKIPTKIGKYPIESKVAEGGMGAVYKGVHPTLNRPVILKRLTLKNSEHLTERFRREARIMMNFMNENIVNFYDHFKAGDSYYIVLEYIDGSDLNNLLGKERYLNCDLALYIFRESCKALRYAHKHQVIHRDIKPANIMFNTSGEVKLVDFGVAHEGSDEEAGLTTDGMTVGTPSYMAPEQFQDSKNVDARADIYSMGVMLYQMVTGKKPFPGGYSPELIAAIQKNKYLPPRKLNPEINGITARIIRKCMRGKADKRYSSVDEIIYLLDRYFRKTDEKAIVDELKARIAGEEVPEKSKAIHLSRLISIASLVLVLALAGAGAWWAGIVHEYLFPDTWSRLNIEIHYPDTQKSSERIFKSVELFRDDDLSIPDVNKKVYLRAVADGEGFYNFKSLPVYLETGRYRVKIQVEDLLYWYTLYLPPRRVQKEDSLTEKGENLLIDITTLPVTEINVAWNVSDCFSGASLNEGLNVKVKKGDDWVSFDRDKEKLMSGMVHKFRFEKESYYSKEYSLKISPYQKRLTIDVAMTPLGAGLHILNSVADARFTLNGSDRYTEGTSVGTIIHIPALEEGINDFNLAPGIYLFEFKGKRKALTRELNLTGGEETNLTLSFNDDETELLLTEE
jgi:eukaryotic-like serine/threonine-protein kinase